MSDLPKHIAIIMDGNGRWAKKRSLPRIAGHRAGGKRVREVIRLCGKKGVEVLTLFAFSSENWQRPQAEVNQLMTLFVKALSDDIDELCENNIKFRVIGDISGLGDKLSAKIVHAQQLTDSNTGLRFNLALNYSGRWDILQAVKKIAEQCVVGHLNSEEVTQEQLQVMLSTHDLPDPDLFIRTSGELRISNFMLWQLAYTELYFTDVLWPDFGEQDLEIALQNYEQRTRRFGKL